MILSKLNISTLPTMIDFKTVNHTKKETDIKEISKYQLLNYIAHYFQNNDGYSFQIYVDNKVIGASLDCK